MDIKYDVLSLDVWGHSADECSAQGCNGDCGGYEVNDRSHAATITMPHDADDLHVLRALQGANTSSRRAWASGRSRSTGMGRTPATSTPKRPVCRSTRSNGPRASMDPMAQQTTHGGPRPGSGRKPTGKPRKQRVTLSLSREALTELEAQAMAAGLSQSEHVEALVKAHKRSK